MSKFGGFRVCLFVNKQINSFYPGKTKQKYPWKWFVTRMMLTVHQKRFSFFFTNGANRPGVNRPVRKMVFERIVPGGTGFGANRPVTVAHYSGYQLYKNPVHYMLGYVQPGRKCIQTSYRLKQN